MRSGRIGQIVKFHSPLPDEDPNQLYIILEVIKDEVRPRALIKPLKTNLSLPPISTVYLNDLEIVEVETSDLIGLFVKIIKADNTQVSGKVIGANDKKVRLDLKKDLNGVETNVWLTVIDSNGQEQIGTLFVN